MKLVLASKELAVYIESNVKDLIDTKARELTPSSSTPEGMVRSVEGSDSSSTTTTPSAAPSLTPAQAKEITDATAALRLGDAKAKAWIAVHVGSEQLSFIANAQTAFD